LQLTQFFYSLNSNLAGGSAACQFVHSAASIVTHPVLLGIVTAAKFRFSGELLWHGSAQGFPRGEAVER